VTISGAPHSVAIAKQMIEQILTQEFGSVQSATAATGSPAPAGNFGGLLTMMGGALPGQKLSTYMEIPLRHVGRCIGKGGSTIKQLVQESGAQLSIDQKPEGQPSIVNMTGSQEQIDKARSLVQAILERESGNLQGMPGGSGVPPMAMGGGAMMGGGYPGMMQNASAGYPAQPMATAGGGSTTAEVPLGTTLFGKIIGKGGETIRNLKAQSGVERIQLEKEPVAVCRITGSETAVAICSQMVAAIVSNDPSAASYYGANSAPRGPSSGGGGNFDPNFVPAANPYAPPPSLYGQQPMGMPAALPAYMMAAQPGQQPVPAALPAYMMAQQPGQQQQQQQQQMMMAQPGMVQTSQAMPAYMQGGMMAQGVPMAQPMMQMHPGMQQMQHMQQPGMQQPLQPATPAAAPLPPAAPPPTQSAWQKHKDPNTGHDFWWNATTGQSSWEEPPEGM